MRRPGRRGKAGAVSLAEARERRGEPMRASALASPADELNQAIIRMLQIDGRIPYNEIAAELDVSEGTIRNRVNRMKQSGMLRIVAIADPSAINYRADAMLGIKVAPGVTPEAVARRLSAFDQIVYILWVSGRYDLLVEVVNDAEEEFLSFVSDNVYNQSDIASVEIMTGMAMFKNQFLLKRGFD
jgi:Lrp/AsnC family transcriptional regulator for asnA, asnC and gidA